MSKKSKIQDNFIGKILKCSNNKNELWYVQPFDKKKQLITITNAPNFFKRLFICIKENDIYKIPTVGELENNKNITIRKKLKGKFLVTDKESIPHWYVNDDLKRVEVTSFDLLDMLSHYAVSVTKEELKSII